MDGLLPSGGHHQCGGGKRSGLESMSSELWGKEMKLCQGHSGPQIPNLSLHRVGGLEGTPNLCKLYVFSNLGYRVGSAEGLNMNQASRMSKRRMLQIISL